MVRVGRFELPASHFVILEVFYHLVLIVTYKFSIYLHPFAGAGHSWMDYIYSPSMRYGVDKPYVILSLTSELSLLLEIFSDFAQFYSSFCKLEEPVILAPKASRLPLTYTRIFYYFQTQFELQINSLSQIKLLYESIYKKQKGNKNLSLDLAIGGADAQT